jgi:hypothetical protein
MTDSLRCCRLKVSYLPITKPTSVTAPSIEKTRPVYDWEIGPATCQQQADHSSKASDNSDLTKMK